ncbi:hypothetical protein ACJX0J_038683, partial [Zea mays]
NHHVDSPFHLVRLPGDERLSAHVANCTLGPWHHLREAREVGQEYPNKRKLPFLALESSFKIVIDSFGKVISSQEQNEIIHDGRIYSLILLGAYFNIRVFLHAIVVSPHEKGIPLFPRLSANWKKNPRGQIFSAFGWRWGVQDICRGMTQFCLWFFFAQLTFKKRIGVFTIVYMFINNVNLAKVFALHEIVIFFYIYFSVYGVFNVSTIICFTCAFISLITFKINIEI